jgi:catechol 2,3-dioxygenase-like lactoylglutathione lyase family enzyme
MIDHIEVMVSDLDRAAAFYREALAPLGYQHRVSGPPHGFGSGPDKLDFWVRPGGPAEPRPHYAFQCADRATVEAAYRAGLAAGGTDNGAPSLLTRIHPTYFAGFVRDPDGHNVEFVCHAPG